MSTFPRRIDRVFVVNSIAPAGLSARELKPTQMALIDVDTQRTVTAADVCTDKRYVWAYKPQGKGINTKLGQDLLGATETILTREFSKLQKAVAFEGATREQKPFIAYLGNDGVSDCKTLKFECGRDYGLVITVKGKDVRDVFGRNMTETIGFRTDCCADCTGSEAVEKTVRTIIKEIDNQAFYIKHYFDVDAIINCCPVPSPFPRTTFKDYCMTICDGGDDSALSDVQSKYNGFDIVRTERKGGLSTYKVECVLNAPADYVQRDTVAPDCSTCPDGFTVVNGGKKYRVAIANTGVGDTAAEWLTEVQTVTAFATAVSAKRLSFDGSVSTYEVLVPTAFVEPTSPIAGVTFNLVSTVKPYCLQTAPVTTEWVECGESYKIKRKMCITIANSDCNATSPDLVELQKAYTSYPDVVPGSILLVEAGDCNSVYEIEQYSNCLVDGCDTVGAEKAKFAHIPAYKGIPWQMCKCEGWTVDNDGCPVPPAPVDGPDCLGGIKFTGKFLDNEFRPCDWDMSDAVYNNAIELEVSIIDRTTELCKVMDVDWQVVQHPTFAQGLGSEVYKEEVMSRTNEGFMYVSPLQQNGTRWANALGFSYSAKPDAIYNNVQVLYEFDMSRDFYKRDNAYNERTVFHVEAHKTNLLNEIKTLVNSLISAKGGCKLI